MRRSFCSDSESIAMVCGVILLAIGTVIFALRLAHREAELRRHRQTAIEYGYARYHPTTGEWEWIEPSNKEEENAQVIDTKENTEGD